MNDAFIPPLFQIMGMLFIGAVVFFIVMFLMAVTSYMIGYYWTLGRHSGLVRALRNRESKEETNHGT